MLNALFGSDARVKILTLFLLGSAEKYSSRKISSELGLPAQSLRRELDNLASFGLIKESAGEEKSDAQAPAKKQRAIRPLKYYVLNQDFLLYPEIKALFTKAQILSSQKFIVGLEKAGRPKLLALTGFFTNYNSPTDMLIVGNIKRTLFSRLIKELEKNLGREVNFTIMSEKEFAYRRNVMDIFLYNILEGKTLILMDNLDKH